MLPTQKKQFESYLKKIKTFHQNTYIFFGIGVVVIIATLAFHSYPEYAKAQELKKEIQQAEEDIEENNKEISELDEELQKVNKDYNRVMKDIKPILDIVFPPEDPTNEVAIFIEDYALTLNAPGHPMIIENITFTTPMIEGNYFVLPFRMNVEADEDNFRKFMRRVDISGSLNKKDFYKGKPVPTMSIEQINITLPVEKDVDPATIKKKGEEEEDEPEVPTYMFNLDMQAYFRAGELVLEEI